MYLFFLMTIDFFSKRKKLRISSYPKKQRKAFLSENPQVLINSPNTPKKKSSDSENKSKKKNNFNNWVFCVCPPQMNLYVSQVFLLPFNDLSAVIFLSSSPKKEKSVQQRNIINHQSKEWNTLRKSRFWFLPKKILKCWSFSPNTQKKKYSRLREKMGKSSFTSLSPI